MCYNARGPLKGKTFRGEVGENCRAKVAQGAAEGVREKILTEETNLNKNNSTQSPYRTRTEPESPSRPRHSVEA
jgi:hypothetical protein